MDVFKTIVKHIGAGAAAIVVFGLLAAFSLYLSQQPSAISMVWYANAAAAVFIAGLPRKYWPVSLVGVAAAQTLVDLLFQTRLDISLSYIPSNLIEIGILALLIQQWFKAVHTNRVGASLLRLSLLMAIPAITGAFIAAVVGYWQFGTAPFDTWITWTISSLFGNITLVPIGLEILRLLKRGGFSRFLSIRGLITATVSIAFALAAFVYLPYPFIYATAALLLLAIATDRGEVPLAVVGFSFGIVIFVAKGIWLPAERLDGSDNALFYLPMTLMISIVLMLSWLLRANRRANRLLASSRDRFRDLYERTPVPLHSIAPDGSLIAVSDGWLNLLGYQREEVLGRQSFDFLTKDSAEYALNVIFPEFKQKGRVRDVPYQMVTKNGDIIHVEISAIWDYDDDGKPFRSLASIRDVTNERRLTDQLERDRELMQVTLDSIADGVVTTNIRGKITYINPVSAELIGMQVADALGRPFDEIFRIVDEISGQPLTDLVTTCINEERRLELPDSAAIRDHQGALRSIQTSISPIQNSQGSLYGTVMVFTDVTEFRANAQHMQYLARHDSLTRLPNRFMLMERLTEACERARRSDYVCSVLFMDLDNFKSINDTLGHTLGDELLKKLALRLESLVRDNDVVARLGGDEFVILLDNTADKDEISELCKRLIAEINKPCAIQEHMLEATVSIGITTCPADSDNAESLLRQADTAMYVAKHRFRNSFHFFSEDIETQVRAKFEAEQKLRNAIQRQYFELHYQPIVNAETGKVEAYEALCRPKPEAQLDLPILELIEIAEETRLIIALGYQLLEIACAKMRERADIFVGEEVKMAFNISAIQLNEPDFVDNLMTILDQYGIKVSQFLFELTETALMQNPEQSLIALQRLKDAGARSAIDDFGTGYSSLSYLTNLPVDIVKIDKSFTNDESLNDESKLELIRAIVSISATMQLNIIAEGVETETQAERLKALGCQYLQGYYFGRPEPIDATTPVPN